MPPVINTALLREWYGSSNFNIASNLTANVFAKTIAESYRFFVSIYPDLNPSANKTDLYNRVGYMPNIRSWHVKSISVPHYSFKKEAQMYGPIPRTFPVLEFDGFDVKITFEEDNLGTIGSLITWFTRATIDPMGLYTPPELIKIPMMSIVSEDNMGIPIGVYTLHDVYYLDASSVDFDYNKTDQIVQTITFNADRINYFYPKQALVGAGVNALRNTIGI